MQKKENTKNFGTASQNFSASKSYFTILQNINKNLIIQNHSIQISEITIEKLIVWINRLECLFDVLYTNNCIIKDVEKIEIAVMKMNEDLFLCYYNAKNVKTWCEFKDELFKNYNTVQKERRKLFCVNNWVKFYNKENDLETGLICKILDDGFCEVLCKGKIIKVHQISLEEY